MQKGSKPGTVFLFKPVPTQQDSSTEFLGEAFPSR